MPFTVKEKKFFLSPESNPGSYIAFSCNVSLVSVNLVQFFSLCLLWSCYFWRITEFFSQNIPQLGFAWCFPSDGRLHIFHRNTTEMTLCLQSIISGGTWYLFVPILGMLILITYLSVRFLHCKTTGFPFVTDFGEGYLETMEISYFSWC